jgi:hypothetical protein
MRFSHFLETAVAACVALLLVMSLQARAAASARADGLPVWASHGSPTPILSSHGPPDSAPAGISVCQASFRRHRVHPVKRVIVTPGDCTDVLAIPRTSPATLAAPLDLPSLLLAQRSIHPRGP